MDKVIAFVVMLFSCLLLVNIVIYDAETTKNSEVIKTDTVYLPTEIIEIHSSRCKQLGHKHEEI